MSPFGIIVLVLLGGVGIGLGLSLFSIVPLRVERETLRRQLNADRQERWRRDYTEDGHRRRASDRREARVARLFGEER